MQNELLARIYHEAPDDIFELIMSKISNKYGRGRFNVFRLVSKRCKQLVESCTTSIANGDIHRPKQFPLNLFKRCNMIEEIVCMSQKLRSLEGCSLLPRLKVLLIEGSSVSSLVPLRTCHQLEVLQCEEGHQITDLSPLAACSAMFYLAIRFQSVTDISVVASMPLLEVFVCQKEEGRPSIKDLSPLSTCTRLISLSIDGNEELDDLSFLSACSALNFLSIRFCPLITSLAPLSSLKILQKLHCDGIDPETSLMPLISCTGLEELQCDQDAVDLEELCRRRPDLKIGLELHAEDDEDDEGEDEGEGEGDEFL